MLAEAATSSCAIVAPRLLVDVAGFEVVAVGVVAFAVVVDVVVVVVVVGGGDRAGEFWLGN